VLQTSGRASGAALVIALGALLGVIGNIGALG
jgi:hypothetical protein